MNYITLLSDYGNASHYAASIKGSLYKSISEVQVIDISHNIHTFDILQAAFVLKNTYQNFPAGTIHFICVDVNFHLYQQIIVAEHNGHYFLAADNGIVNLMFDEIPASVWVVKEELVSQAGSFIENGLFVQIAAHISSKKPLEAIAQKGAIRNNSHSQAIEISDNMIRAKVVFIDGFNNAFVNVSKPVFEHVRKGRKFKIYYHGKEYIDKIVSDYSQAKGGEDLALFNHNDYMEIAMNRGQASQLLGIKIGHNIIIEFSDK
ncbi:MAG: SAM-dependent chlorinase/fluorinase [Bacteroidota bacterium]